MPNDLERLRAEYEARKNRFPGDDRYSLSNRTYNFAIQQRHQSLIRLLEKCNQEQLSLKRVLEIGCGSGGVLDEFQQLGADSEFIFGIDLLFDRLEEAHLRLPAAGISNADGQNLPFPEDSFDLLLQYTAFSSILDSDIKKNLAADMLRVLKQSGSIIWYDFCWNPTNRQTREVTPKEIRKLFPNCNIRFSRITLAPPIARRIVPISWKLAVILESMKFMNSHYLAIIHKM